MSFAAVTCEVAFTTDPADPSPVWEDISDYLLSGDITGASRQQILERVEGGSMRLSLRNDDRRFDPTYEGEVGNLVGNPSFEIGTTGWTLVSSFAPTTAARNNGWAGYGTWAYKIADAAFGAGGHFAGPNYAGIPATVGSTYSASVRLNVVTNPSAAQLYIDFRDGGGLLLQRTAASSAATGVSTLTFAAVAPAGTVTVGVGGALVNTGGAPAAGEAYFDGFALNLGALQSYTDGTQAGSHWAGAAHGSVSYVDAPYWPNVVPGRRVRIIATHDSIDYPLFSGFVDSWPQNWVTPNYATTDLVAGDGFYAFSGVVVGESETWPEELSGDRIDRVLDLFGWPAGDRDLEPGVSLIPAATWDAAGVDALGHMQDVADSDLGAFFISADGLATFHDRHHRIAPGGVYTSLATFGTDDINYQDAQPDYGAAWIINKAVITCQSIPNADPELPATEPGTGTAEDTTSRDRYGPRGHSRTPLLTDVNQAQGMAEWIVFLRKDPQLRFESLGFRLASGTDDDVWAEALGRLFGDRITVIAEPAGGGERIDVDCHIEGVSHGFQPGVWEVSWPLSPASVDDETYWLLEDAIYGELDVTTRLAV